MPRFFSLGGPGSRFSLIQTSLSYEQWPRFDSLAANSWTCDIMLVYLAKNITDIIKSPSFLLSPNSMLSTCMILSVCRTRDKYAPIRIRSWFPSFSLDFSLYESKVHILLRTSPYGEKIAKTEWSSIKKISERRKPGGGLGRGSHPFFPFLSKRAELWSGD